MASSKSFRLLAGGGDTNQRLRDGSLDWKGLDRLETQVIQAKREVARLTQRQQQVLMGIVQGSSNKQIARDLGISPRTVEIHRGLMMERLEARTTADAMRIGIYACLDWEE